MCGPWPMHEMLFLAFQIASTSRILRLNPCALDSVFWPRISCSSPPRCSGGLLPPWSRGLEFGGGARDHGEWAVFTFSPSITWASQCKSLAVNMLIWQENLRGQMAWARVNVKHTWCISLHQPTDWSDSIWASDNRHTWGCSHCGKLRSVSFLTQRTRVM